MITEFNEFQYLHDYLHLVEQGAAEPLVHGCGQRYIIVNRDGLRLWCPTDNEFVAPGLALLERIAREVDDIFTIRKKLI